MNISVSINKCSDCRHEDHSGSFTPGGAIHICGHNNRPKMAYVPEVKDFNDVTTPEIAERVWSRVKLNDDMSIPRWCPLKNGGSY